MRVPLRGNSWRLLLPAALLLALLCVVASAPAKDLEEKLQDTQGKLSHVREDQSALAATIAEQNAAIDSMIGEVSALRQQQAAVEAELSAKEGELDAATEKLEADQRTPRRGPRSAASAPSMSCANGWSRSTRRAAPTCSTWSSTRPAGRKWPRAEYLNRIQSTTTRSLAGSRACATKRAPRSSG